MQKLISCKSTIRFLYTEILHEFPEETHFICRTHTCACAHAYSGREPAGVFMLPWGSTSKKSLDISSVLSLQQHKINLYLNIRLHVRVFAGQTYEYVNERPLSSLALGIDTMRVDSRAANSHSQHDTNITDTAESL